MKQSIRLGAGAGYSGDRIEPAVELAAKGDLDYLVFECLAERTIALAQQRKSADADAGYDPLLEARLRACLPHCHRNRVRVISNMGAAHPPAAARKTVEIARNMGLHGLKIATVTGDDVLDRIMEMDADLLESGEPLGTIRDRVIAANAYLGIAGILAALEKGADIILTGRVADPSLYLAPLVHEFEWDLRDYALLGQGTVLGHLMECAGQLSGGYFAEPGRKDVPDLARLGFPIAEAEQDGSFLVTKLPDSGGMITPATCKEQLLYEIHDPARYFTPDVVADFSAVEIKEIAKDRVTVRGGSGGPPSGMLKVSVAYHDGYIGEGQISYGGTGAVARGRLALDIVRERIRMLGIPVEETRFDLIGVDALYGERLSGGQPFEVRARVASRTADRQAATRIGNEVEALYTNGPAGGGGAVKSVSEVIALQSLFLESEAVRPQVEYMVT